MMNQPPRSVHQMRRGSWNDYTAYPISDATLRAGLRPDDKNLRNVDQVVSSVTRRSRYYDDLSTNPLRLDIDRLKDYTKNVNYCWTNPPKKDKHSQSRNEADAESITVIFLHGTNRQVAKRSISIPQLLLKLFFVTMQKNAGCNYPLCDFP
eukprot:scaffold158549_cov75-Cyclotella_meneghiniana.AAC.1